jgi:hypothetical protein
MPTTGFLATVPTAELWGTILGVDTTMIRRMEGMIQHP